jgi:hypothetical protein
MTLTPLEEALMQKFLDGDEPVRLFFGSNLNGPL